MSITHDLYGHILARWYYSINELVVLDQHKSHHSCNLIDQFERWRVVTIVTLISNVICRPLQYFSRDDGHYLSRDPFRMCSTVACLLC